ncbi:DUF6247 family protein [Streptomyces albogriseolus]|uniref:DUF6247 family protein n=1 Tax=Streptomyces albogriseolus TaxID=1887 RepID=UPI0033BA7366
MWPQKAAPNTSTSSHRRTSDPPPAAQLLAQLRADHRAESWVPAFQRDWAKALEEFRHAYSLTSVHNVIRIWQLHIAAVPAIDANP